MKKIYQYLPSKLLYDTHESIKNASDKTLIPKSTLWDHLDTDQVYRGFLWYTYEINASKQIRLEDSPITYETPTLPKILIFDIETAPVKGYVWRLWKQDIGLPQIISDWFCLTWSAKWLGGDTIMSERLTGKEAIEEDDSRIVKKLWDLFDECDMVIAHNGNQFDVPKMNTRFIKNGLMPPSSYRQIDTKIIAKNQFGFSSNKLQFLAQFFGIEGKFDTDFELWAECLKGSETALEYMELYNRHDVEILEKVFIKLRPYAKGLPNLDLYINESSSVCPTCGSHDIAPILGKSFYTQAVQYQLYRCNSCKALSRAKKGDKLMYKPQISAIPR